MRQFKHKLTGDIADKANDYYYSLKDDLRTMPIRLIENSNDWEEIIDKKPLFRTSDGVDIYEGDTYYFPMKDKQDNLIGIFMKVEAMYNSILHPTRKRFSTPELAQMYINENMKKYSISDISKAYTSPHESPLFQSLIDNLKSLDK